MRFSIFGTASWADAKPAADARVFVADKTPEEGYSVLVRRSAEWHQVLLLVACTACAAVQPSPASSSFIFADPSADRPAGTDRSVITRAEIAPWMLSAYDVVANRRRPWLRTRGMFPTDGGRPEAPLVYLDGIRYGSCETLKSIEASAVSELRFLDALEATTRFGPGHVAGAILVTLRLR